MPTPLRTTLWRVLLIQLLTLAVLGLMQDRYHIRVFTRDASTR